MTSSTPAAGQDDAAARHPDYPPQLYRAKDSSHVRQGDLCFAYFQQLRTPKDAAGPGDETIMGRDIPFFGPSTDHPFKLADRNLVLRVWAAWVMVLNQGCDLARQDENDARLIVAPVVFSSKWPGAERWRQIRAGSAPGYLFLPPPRESDLSRTGKLKGWPLGVEAAVVLASTTAISRMVAGAPAFGLTLEMQHLLQQRLVTFFSVRDWKAAKQRAEIIGKQVRAISETDEKPDGPAKLYKVHLADPGGLTGDDEITVAMLFRK